MRAVYIPRFGGPEVLTVGRTSTPDPLPTEVLVQVHAAGVNPVDCKTRAGRGMAPVLGDPPIPLGWDVSGQVVGRGVGVARFEDGDDVVGLVRFPHRAGAYAEYVTAPSRHLVHKPAEISHIEAAGLPLAGLTAWQALVDVAGIHPGDLVLVHGGGGGVGHLAIQLAKARGAWVASTASRPKHAFVRSLGADRIIDYRTAAFEELLDPVDVVLDLVGGNYVSRSLQVLRPGGVYVTVHSGVPAKAAARARAAGQRIVFMLVEPDHCALESVMDLVSTGRLRCAVSTVLPLDQVAIAHRLLESGGNTGKTVLTVGPPGDDRRLC